ncbi:MAG: BamA/TamA family outer membrane protein [Bacteroidota bacterium]
MAAPSLAQDTTRYEYQSDIIDVLTPKSKKGKRDDSAAVAPGKLQFSALPVIGYQLQTGFLGGVTGNMAFRKANSKVSNVPVTFAYTAKNQTIFYILPNIWSKDNTYNITGEFGYLHFPQFTYGIGPRSSLNDSVRIDYTQVRVDGTVMRKIRENVFAGAGYILDYYYGIKVLSNSDLATRYPDFPLAAPTVSSGLTFSFLFDDRANSINPLDGSFVNVMYRPYLEAFGSTSNWQSLLIDLRKYIPFPRNSGNTIALWSYNWLTLSGKPPYNNLPGTGFDNGGNTGRGYIQGRFRGTNMVYLESEYRFKLLRNGLLGGVVFVNGQSVNSVPGTGLGPMQPGYGAGLRVKLNKYSSTNVAIDYGLGNAGSRGFFLGVCEVF